MTRAWDGKLILACIIWKAFFNAWTEWNVAIHLTLYKTMSYVVLKLFLQQMKIFLQFDVKFSNVTRSYRNILEFT